MYHLCGCTLIYRPLSYPFKSLTENTLCREQEANEDLRAMHDREAERLSEELEARNREVKQYEEKERKLKVRIF